jgi:hypothetical protein
MQHERFRRLPFVSGVTLKMDHSRVPLLSVSRSTVSTRTVGCPGEKGDCCAAPWARQEVALILQSPLLLQMVRSEGTNRCIIAGAICRRARPLGLVFRVWQRKGAENGGWGCA